MKKWEWREGAELVGVYSAGSSSNSADKEERIEMSVASFIDLLSAVGGIFIGIREYHKYLSLFCFSIFSWLGTRNK